MQHFFIFQRTLYFIYNLYGGWSNRNKMYVLLEDPEMKCAITSLRY